MINAGPCTAFAFPVNDQQLLVFVPEGNFSAADILALAARLRRMAEGFERAVANRAPGTAPAACHCANCTAHRSAQKRAN